MPGEKLFFKSHPKFPQVSADRHLADLYLALFLKVGCVFVKKRFWMQLVILLKTAAFCSMNFTWVDTTRATLQIVCASDRDVGPCEERCHTLGRCVIRPNLHYAVRALGVELQVES